MDIVKIAEEIKEYGGTLYLVGGALRDEMIGKSVEDEDYCVTGMTKEEFMKLFPGAKLRGKAFPVFDIEHVEFALARKEKKAGVGHKEFEIESGKEITIEEDLARRDITINAIAKNVLTGEIIDPYGGIEDIKQKKIRATTEHFKEDPLRVYRVARIAASTEFQVEENTLKLMNSLKRELETLSKERIFCELEKALATKKPSIFFQILKQADVLQVHFKEIYDLIGSLQPIQYHPEGDSYNHTMLVVDKAAILTHDIAIRFAALVHDLGKGQTPKEKYPHHHGHDEKGIQLVQNLGQRIGLPNKWISYGKISAKEHMKGGIFYKMTPAKKVTFIERIAKSKLGLHGLQIVVIADKCSTRNTNPQDIQFEELGKQCLTAIDGNYIKQKYNLPEGIRFSMKLHQERVNWMKKQKTKE